MLNAIKGARICKVEDTDSKYTACKNRKSIKEMYNDGEIVSLDEFAAEWMRQLELHFKNCDENQELTD